MGLDLKAQIPKSSRASDSEARRKNILSLKKVQMKRFSLIIFYILTISSLVFSQEKLGLVSGKVTDKLSGQPIAGATVSAGNKETQTDSEGNYKLEIPAGEYNLRFRADGFAEILTAQISITANRTFVQNAQLSIVLSEEKVEVKSDVFASTEDRPVSQTSLNRDEIRNTPGSGGDLLRSISSLPSVTSIGAEFGDYIVRGGKTDEKSPQGGLGWSRSFTTFLTEQGGDGKAVVSTGCSSSGTRLVGGGALAEGSSARGENSQAKGSQGGK